MSKGSTTLSLVIDAIKDNEDRKGASIQGIKAYILKQCPEKTPDAIKTLLKKAITKGLDDGVLVRPARDAGTGYSLTGRLKINKDKISKVAAPKPKKVVAKPAKTEAKAKTTKKPKMPKTPLKQGTPVKEKKPKSPAKKVTKPASKPKAPKAKTTAKTTPKKTRGRN